ncbi:MAG TPA: rhomboid family intramembrane serine protease [Herpetosiphonaceae bacterium]
MFPIGDQNRHGHITPVVNYALIAINIAVFLYQITLPDPQTARSCAETVAATVQGFVCQYGVVPAEIVGGQDLFTLLTSMFVHGGWAHIIGNMMFLWVFGDNVEDAFGHLGYLIFYLVTGLAASAAHILLDSSSTIPSVGASGAISGVLGAYIVFFGSNPIRVLIAYFITVVPAWIMIGLWAIQQFIATYGSIAATEQTGGGVAYAAHAGGFIAGLVLGIALRGTLGQPEQRPTSSGNRFA